MYGWQYQGSGPGWFLVMAVVMIVFWTVLIGGVVLAVKHFSGPRHAQMAASTSPIEVLRLRLARGEIDDEEFSRRRALLDETK